MHSIDVDWTRAIGRALSALLCACVFAGVSADAATPVSAPASATADGSLSYYVDEIVARYRKIIVLAGVDKNDKASLVGRLVYHEQLRWLETLSAILRSNVTSSGTNRGFSFAAEDFLDLLERDQRLWDADKLAFREVLEDLAETLERSAVAPERRSALKTRIGADLKALDEIQSLYGKELEQVLTRLGLRGMPVRRQSWERYVEHLKTLYQPETILSAYEKSRPLPTFTRGAGNASDKRGGTIGSGFARKTILLTFDDGPHARYSEQVLAVLKKHGATGIFFQVGNHLGKVDDKDKATLSAQAEISRAIVKSGSVLANHSFSHLLLPNMDEKQIETEVKRTNRLIKEIDGKEPVLFRPPYGALSPEVDATLRAENMKTILWNVDSLDWADPVPESIAQRVLENVDGEERGIILFHDIHKRTVAALDIILTKLRENGYRFASWDGEAFVAPDAPARVARPKAAPGQELYRESYAAVIGVDDYQQWPKLRYAVNDAKAVRELLIRRYRFKPENVFTLYNEEATRKNILSLLGDKLADPQRVKPEDRVFVFFAGHGATRKLASGRDLGYIVPVEADVTNVHGQTISMTNFRDVAEAIPAKHLFFVMDSCYSGLGLTRGAATPAYIGQVSKRTARQILTAGGADQEVADGGPNGHSVFTWTLLQALEGKADLNGDGFITASELAAYTVPLVASVSQQTPAFGNMLGSEGGDFVFDNTNEAGEFLSDVSGQLDDQAISLNAELDRLRAEIVHKRERNAKLRKEVESARKLASAEPTAEKVPDTAIARNDRGLALFKEKKYSQALVEFQAGARLDPTDVQAANNVGFVYFKLGKYSEAVTWIRKALELDPQRAIAYRNLGDAYDKLGQIDDARAAYEKFLALNSSSKLAVAIQEKLKTLH